MARTAVTVTTLGDGFTERVTGTTADPTNDHTVAVPFPLDELVLVVTQTDATARDATIVAGDSPPAFSAGQGDLTQSVDQDEEWIVAGLESARFLQNDGSLHIDLAASFAGTIEAYRVPRA